MLPSRFSHRVVLVAALSGAMTSPLAIAQTRPPGYLEAERSYEAAYTVEQRLRFQVLMTAAGYWNAVPNENFNLRLFKAVQRFQSANGYTADGVVTKPIVDRLLAIGGPMLDTWGFRKVSHPTRDVSIWVPFGLGLLSSRKEHGVDYADPQNRVRLSFTTVPNVDVDRNFVALVGMTLRDGATIHYKAIKDGWFVISASTPGGVDHYLRYHQDGANVTGFTLSWNNTLGNVSAERIAILMSASLWSNMTGAAFLDPPPVQVVSRPSPPPSQPPDRVAVQPAPVPRAEAKGSSGTGFFVAGDGSFITNAHVIDDCSTVRVKSDDGSIQSARVIAKDPANDLALLKIPNAVGKFANLRLGLRLGEAVAAFGFPHTDMLSSSGNFTLGNVTALTGLRDDVRYVQISAPVQSGNSGGPLLDGSGNVIGVVTAKLNALKVALSNGDLPQNVNFAVKATILSTFLDANRVAYVVGPAASKAVDPADLADQAKAISGLVVCR